MVLIYLYKQENLSILICHIIISMHPDVNDLTDEEQFNNDNLDTPVVSDVAGPKKITVPFNNDIIILGKKFL